jgi:hypothetical protein
MPVPCGSTMCTPRANPLSALIGQFAMGATVPGLPAAVACCVDAAKGTCGVAAAEGAMCELPATPDARCMGINLGALGAAAAGLNNFGRGCCTPSNQCGLDGAIFGRGCVENGEARSMLSAVPFVGTLLSVPPSRACDAPPVTIPTDDAGANDAGI